MLSDDSDNTDTSLFAVCNDPHLNAEADTELKTPANSFQNAECTDCTQAGACSSFPIQRIINQGMDSLSHALLILKYSVLVV